MTHKVTAERRKLAEKASGMGIPHEQIALLIDCDAKTLRKHYAHELITGKAKANFNVGSKLYDKCMQGETACIIFWAKTQMGFRETTQLTTPPGEPIEVTDPHPPAELLGPYYARLSALAAERRAFTEAHRRVARPREDEGSEEEARDPPRARPRR